MEWFSQKTSIAGIQIPNWAIVLGAVIVILLVSHSRAEQVRQLGDVHCQPPGPRPNCGLRPLGCAFCSNPS